MFRLSDIVVVSLDNLIEEAKNSFRSKFSFYFACEKPSVSIVYPWDTSPDPELYAQSGSDTGQLLEISIQPYRSSQYGVVTMMLFCILLTVYRGQRRRAQDHRLFNEGPRENRHVISRVIGWFVDSVISTFQCLISPIATIRYLWNRKKVKKEQIALFKRILSNTTYNPGHADFDQETCTICLEVFQVSEKLLSLDCKHYFHPLCIANWLKSKELPGMNCPLCHAHIASNTEEATRNTLREDLLQVYLGTLKNSNTKPKLSSSIVTETTSLTGSTGIEMLPTGATTTTTVAGGEESLSPGPSENNEGDVSGVSTEADILRSEGNV